MKRAIVSGVLGAAWMQIASVTWPHMRQYAEMHGCEFFGVELRDFGRPLSWSKLASIAECLASFDEVLWIDADVAVQKKDKLLFDDFLPGYSHGLCWMSDQTGQGHFNCGVWVARRSAMPLFVEAAMDDASLSHVWWEQAAVNKLAGRYPPCRLPNEWNWWVGDPSDATARFRHACGLRGGLQLVAVKEWLS